MEGQEDIQAQTQESKAWPKLAIIVLNWNVWRDEMVMGKRQGTTD